MTRRPAVTVFSTHGTQGILDAGKARQATAADQAPATAKWNSSEGCTWSPWCTPAFSAAEPLMVASTHTPCHTCKPVFALPVIVGSCDGDTG